MSASRDPLLHPAVLAYNRVLIEWMRRVEDGPFEFRLVRRDLLAAERRAAPLRLPRVARRLHLRRHQVWTLRYALARALAGQAGLVVPAFELDDLSRAIDAPLEALVAEHRRSPLVREGLLVHQGESWKLREGFATWLIGGDPELETVEPDPAVVAALSRHGATFRRLLREAGGTIHLVHATPDLAAALLAATGLHARTVKVGVGDLPLAVAHAAQERLTLCAYVDAEDDFDMMPFLFGELRFPTERLPPVVAWPDEVRVAASGSHTAILDLRPLRKELRRAGVATRGARPRRLDAAFYGDAATGGTAEHPAENLGDLVLDDETLRRVRAVAEQARGERCVVLLHGRPGTGKSFAARCLAGELDRPLRVIRPEQVRGMFWGETEKHLRRVFDEAEDKGAVLLIDEADDWLGRRDALREPYRSQATMLLTIIEDYQGVLVLTTNRSEAIDPAVFRRVDHAIPFPAPDLPGRMALWARQLGEIPPAALAVLASIPLTGGDIAAAVREAGGPEAPLRRLVAVARRRAERRAVQG